MTLRINVPISLPPSTWVAKFEKTIEIYNESQQGDSQSTVEYDTSDDERHYFLLRTDHPEVVYLAGVVAGAHCAVEKSEDTEPSLN